MSARRVALFGLVILSLAACREESIEAAARDSAPPPAAAAAPTDLGGEQVDRTIEIGGPPLVREVRLGGRLGPDGSLEADAARFRAGAPIHLILELEQAPPGSAASAVWRRGEKTLLRQRLEVEPGSTRIRFTVEQTADWAPGTYQVDVSMGGSEVETLEFVIDE
ncbi:MAG TPA: hypothetical protein VMS56_10405 [Thermoanaerobaculia bacterium]|nr:hypothetical protein [Thermoanaerobaculia bacterium]